MRTLHRRILVAVILSCLFLASIGIGIPAAAGRNVLYSLYGSSTEGWGFSNVTLRIPGPDMTVEVGDNVTLTLHSVDGNRHNWFLDYNNDSIDTANEPNSPTFRFSTVTWNFTADRNGTFPYRSRFDPDTMWGNITIRPAGSTPAGIEGTVIFLGAAVVLFVAVLALAALFWRRPRSPLPPPPPG